jgi:hypothetical protein
MAPMRYVSPLLFLLLVIVGVKLSDQVYRWIAYGPERAQIRVLRSDLLDAGADMVRFQRQSDSIGEVLHGADAALEQEERALRRYDEQSVNGLIPPDLYAHYRHDLDRYNAHVAERNAHLEDARGALGRYRRAVGRYTLLADSVHELALKLGDPYYAIPSPAEAAVARGVIKPIP